MAKVTDIKNTKIRVENEEHSKAIQKDAFDIGYAWDDGNSTFFSNRSFIFFDDGLEIMSCDAPQTFERDKAKEIFFYNGKFHDKPQDEIDLDVSGQLDKLLESIKGESEAKKEKIKSLEKGLEKLSALGYEYHQGEWLSKEEIEKHERLKAAYDLFCTFKDEAGVVGYCNYEKWFETQPIDSWLAIVDKTGYSKGEL